MTLPSQTAGRQHERLTCLVHARHVGLIHPQAGAQRPATPASLATSLQHTWPATTPFEGVAHSSAAVCAMLPRVPSSFAWGHQALALEAPSNSHMQGPGAGSDPMHAGHPLK